MSRTGEMIITFLGFVVYSFIALLAGATVWMNKNQDKVAEMLSEENSSEVDFTKEEFLTLIEEIGGSGWIVLAGTAIAMIAGGVAIYFLRGNKNAKAAGITLIISAILSTVMTFLLTFIGGIIYLIAGIIALVRKPKNELQL